MNPIWDFNVDHKEKVFSFHSQMERFHTFSLLSNLRRISKLLLLWVVACGGDFQLLVVLRYRTFL